MDFARIAIRRLADNTFLIRFLREAALLDRAALPLTPTNFNADKKFIQQNTSFHGLQEIWSIYILEWLTHDCVGHP